MGTAKTIFQEKKAYKLIEKIKKFVIEDKCCIHIFNHHINPANTQY